MALDFMVLGLGSRNDATAQRRKLRKALSAPQNPEAQKSIAYAVVGTTTDTKIHKFSH